MKPNYAAIAYEAYRNHTSGKSLVTGQTIPEWHELREDIQLAWMAAADAVEMEIAKRAVVSKIAESL